MGIHPSSSGSPMPPGQTRLPPSTTSTSTSTGTPSTASAGEDNSAVLARVGTGTDTGSETPILTGLMAEPDWTEDEIKAIQRELRRLGLYALRIDGDFGPGSRAGMIEAFGGQQWRAMSANEALVQLQGATAPEAGLDNFRYGALFQDGVLDLTIGVGFDEGDNHLDAIEGFQDVLSGRGFVLDAGLAAELYAQAGRTLEHADFGQYYVLENALQYTPPVGGEPRDIHAVVRLVFSETGEEGAEASAAFREGMAESDVAYYSGHGRYGSGPDFDRNMTFDLLDADGNVEQHLDDYTVLERVLRDEGRRPGRSAWQQFQWRARHDRILVNGSNAGNVFLNAANQHRGEFGGLLMYWNLQREQGGAEVQTGAEGPLAGALESPEARDYRVLVFDGCRTRDYVRSVRRTPGLENRGTDILGTTRTVNWGDEVNTLAAFLDGIISRTNRADVIEGMDQQQGPSSPGGRRGGAYRGF